MSQGQAADRKPPTASHSNAYIGFLVLLLLLANTLSYADRHLFSVLVPAIKDEFQLSDAWIGLIGGPVFVVSYVLFSFPLATLADRYSHRGVLASSIALFSAATAWCASAISSSRCAPDMVSPLCRLRAAPEAPSAIR